MSGETLRTTADPSLPEEMRWLAMYDEVGWSSVVPEFWERYTVLADQREHALAWLDGNLAELLLHWPEPGPDAQTPFILMLLRGKAYLRMQYSPPRRPHAQPGRSRLPQRLGVGAGRPVDGYSPLIQARNGLSPITADASSYLFYS